MVCLIFTPRLKLFRIACKVFLYLGSQGLASYLQNGACQDSDVHHIFIAAADLVSEPSRNTILPTRSNLMLAIPTPVLLW